jgi:hypothetical protein
MTAVPATWEPANEVERTMRDAWLRNDTVSFLRTLAAAPLYLPGFSRRDTEQRLLTWQHDGRVHLMVFTSPESLHQQLTGVIDGWRLTGMAEVIRSLPDPEWGVAINPNAPIGACLNPDELATLAELIAEEPVFQPATSAEALMFRGQHEGQPSAYLDALVLTTVMVPVTEAAAPEDIGRPGFPWRIEATNGEATVSAFTSDLRLAAVVSDQVPVVRVEMMALAHAWPDPAVRLAINPGSAIAATFTGDQVADLIEWARALVAREQATSSGPPPASVSAAPPGLAVEAVVEPDDVERYLSGRYQQVHGVRPRSAVAPPVGTYLIRWQQLSATDPVGVSLVDGARMMRVDPGGERLVATYQAELRRWLPAIADLLRGSALS